MGMSTASGYFAKSCSLKAVGTTIATSKFGGLVEAQVKPSALGFSKQK
jgi:hypothetical protein